MFFADPGEASYIMYQQKPQKRTSLTIDELLNNDPDAKEIIYEALKESLVLCQ